MSALTFPSLAALVSRVAAITVEQVLSWPYGPAGIVGLLLLGAGLRTRRPAWSSAGALVLALLVLAQSR